MSQQEAPSSPLPEAQQASQRFASFLRSQRMSILSRWASALHTRHPELPPDTPEAQGRMPELLAVLADDMAAAGEEPSAARGLPEAHVLRRLEQGYEAYDLAAEFGLLREAILQEVAQQGLQPSLGVLARLGAVLDRFLEQAMRSAMRTRERMLAGLERVSRAALHSQDVDAFLQRVVQVITEVALTADVAIILLSEGERLVVRAVAGLEVEQLLGLSVGMNESFTGQVVTGRQPLLSHMGSRDPRITLPGVQQLGLRALYGVPLLHGDTVVGVAHVGSRHAHTFAEADLLLFRTLAVRSTAFIVQAELAARERAVQAEAQRTLAQLDTLVRAAPVGVAFLDRELRFLRINDALARLNRRPAEQHLGRRFREMVPREVIDVFEPVFRRVLDTGEPVVGHEFESDPHDPAARRYWLGSYYPVRTEDGEVLGMGCVAMDITRRKQVEQELRREAELRERLMAVVGHDLRNPLNAITASVWQLGRAESLGPEARRALSRIRTSAARMGRMLDDILDFARASLGGGLPLQRRPVDLHELCRSVLEELQVAWPQRRLTLQVHGNGWGEWDGDRLAQVVGNLVANALQHGREDSPVEVVVEEAGQEVLLRVHNQGPPIPPEKRERLFQPFAFSSSQGGGQRHLGLGLYIVSQVTLAHGGSVEVSSSEEGTTFTVRLPRQPALSPPPPEALSTH